jgi:hypothetical protein
MRPSARRVLRALEAAGGRGATTHDLCQPDVGGIRFGARIKELRDEGYEIRRVEERAGSHRYTLTGPKGSA